MEKLIKELRDLLESKDKKIAELEEALADGKGIHNHYHYHNTYSHPQTVGYQGLMQQGLPSQWDIQNTPSNYQQNANQNSIQQPFSSMSGSK